MLILCCGPDTYRATQRAHELEEAFRTKHDPSGTSIERFESGKGAVDEVIERSLTVSLFSPMRFIRADGLIEHCPKPKAKALANALSKDPERVIVVSIEQEKPTNTELKPFTEVPKLIVNDYPLLRGKAFEDWVRQAGGAMGVTDEQALIKLARACDGDAWLASNELLKLAAGGASDVVLEQESNFYDQADAFLRKDKTRHNILSAGDREKLMYPLLQQSMAAMRAQSGDTSGLPPFVISKLRNINPERVHALTASSILMLLLSRSGLSDAEEVLNLLP
ncbi:hypothetical protein M0Q28_06635 [Patescibacteria group bacterium]|jgi:DNA polymerase III delta subunit|nr:hypothetical protein [Patescibacteria group bacterium]